MLNPVLKNRKYALGYIVGWLILATVQLFISMSFYNRAFYSALSEGLIFNALYAVTGEIPLVILENKTDLESGLEDDERESISSRYNTPILKTSAKEDVNVEEAFRKVTSDILQRARDRKSASATM